MFVKTLPYATGEIRHRSYWVDGQKHRDDGPASIWYYKNGTVQHETYMFRGKKHRDNGPAIILYNNKSEPVAWEFYKDGTVLPKDAFDYVMDEYGRVTDMDSFNLIWSIL